MVDLDFSVSSTRAHSLIEEMSMRKYRSVIYHESQPTVSFSLSASRRADLTSSTVSISQSY